MSVSRTTPINEAGADEVLAAIDSPVLKNLVRVAVATARMQFILRDGQTEESWASQLPKADFDMGFFARVVAQAFRNEDVLRAILSGSSIEEASGWDV